MLARVHMRDRQEDRERLEGEKNVCVLPRAHTHTHTHTHTQVWQWLPARHRLKTAVLVYAGERDGCIFVCAYIEKICMAWL